MTETGQRFLADAQAMLTHAEEADQRMRDDFKTLSGHLRVFATFDCGQSIVTRLVSRFLQNHPRVTVSLAMANRPLHMIQEGCDVGILPGKITDESVIARPAGMITLHLAAAPGLVKSRPVAKHLADLKSWPWVALMGSQFWGTKEIRLTARNGDEQVLQTSPVLTSEGVTSIREAVRDGLGVALLPDWLIEEDLRSGRLMRVLPKLKAKDLPIHVVYLGQRLLPARVSAFIDFAVSYMMKELDQSRERDRGL